MTKLGMHSIHLKSPNSSGHRSQICYILRPLPSRFHFLNPFAIGLDFSRSGTRSAVLLSLSVDVWKETGVMDRHVVFRCALGVVLAVVVGQKSVVAAEPAPAGGIQWQRDLQSAHRESLRLNRPVLIVFGAEWCHFCTKLEKESLGHPQIAQFINQTYIPVHLNFDEAQREAGILDVKAIPCVVALTPQAELVGRLDGFASPQKVGEMLSKANRLQMQLQQARSTQTASRAP
jgi:thiol-disulfide isomerase/thioredoxin